MIELKLRATVDKVAFSKKSVIVLDVAEENHIEMAQLTPMLGQSVEITFHLPEITRD